MINQLLIYAEGPNGCVMDEETCDDINVAINIYQKLLEKYHQKSDCTIITKIGNHDFDDEEE